MRKVVTHRGTAVLILAISLCLMAACKNREKESLEAPAKIELLPVYGYLDSRWGQSKEEVMGLLNTRGLSRAKKGEWGEKQYIVELSALEYSDTLLDLSCIVAYNFNENKLETVLMFFRSNPENRSEKWDELKVLLADKYKAPQIDLPEWVMWNASNTIIELRYSRNPFSDRENELLIAYHEKDAYLRKMEGLLKDMTKKSEEAKKKI